MLHAVRGKILAALAGQQRQPGNSTDQGLRPRGMLGAPSTTKHLLMSPTTEPTSVRDYFAANAPTEIPIWFKPDMRALPLPRMLSLPAAIQGHITLTGVAVDDDGLPKDGEVDDPMLLAAINAHRIALADRKREADAVDEQREEYRYFAWRWYYAEQMVKTKSPPKAGVY